MHACSPTEPTDGAAGTLDAGHFVGSSEQQYMWHTPAVPRVYMCAFLTQHGGALKTSLKKLWLRGLNCVLNGVKGTTVPCDDVLFVCRRTALGRVAGGEAGRTRHCARRDLHMVVAALR